MVLSWFGILPNPAKKTQFSTAKSHPPPVLLLIPNLFNNSILEVIH